MLIKYSSPAKKQLKKIPQNKAIKILQTIERLQDDPLAGKPLQGKLKHLRSLRVWPYRIIYHYSAAEKLIFIELVDHRQGVYKNL